MSEAALLEVRDITTTRAGVGPDVLSGVSFGVRAGERSVVTGPSGSGKTTLLRCMVLLEPARGRVLLDGAPVGPSRVRELRRRVGYVSQRPVGIEATVAADLAFARGVGDGALGEAEQRALLERLGLGELDHSRRFDALSGGEQQRVALVRSLTPRPDVLLLDEPTASLDPENVGAVLELIRGWLEEDAGRGVVWVSHQAHEVEELATRRVAMAELTG